MPPSPELAPAETAAGDLGTIGVRVVVLPRKGEVSNGFENEQPTDLTPDEILSEVGASPVASYLERPKSGKLCCVFLVNGQRHEGLDNSFIVQQLKFKYLRKRMMIIVDVDGLRPEALGELMQGSRQSFYQGRVWEAVRNRLISTLSGDPDLQKLEEEAEAEVAEMEAGDQRVKEALDTLIEAHHEHADHVVTGAGLEPGMQTDAALLGGAAPVSAQLVSLLDPEIGGTADYPVLVSAPDGPSLWLKPGVERSLTISCQPPNAWPALASLGHALDSKVPALHIAEERSATGLTLKLRFNPPSDFDQDEYPVRVTLRVTARFNGFKEARQLAVALIAKPPVAPPPPVLLDEPTVLKVSTRQPVQLWLGAADTHVRIRWNGKDDLALGPAPKWTFTARSLTPSRPGVPTTFSQPHEGRFSLLVSLAAEAKVGEQLRFEIIASGPNSKRLVTSFDAVVAQHSEPVPPEPRLINGTVPSGASRRPPYELKYITREKWTSPTCFGGDEWTADDAGSYQEPTEKQPLTLLINTDMAPLEAFKKHLVARRLSENEVQSRLMKYTSHVAYHLYQMYQSVESLARPLPGAQQEDDESRRPATPTEERAEIRRVAMTLLKLMEISR